jgi:hypothetical protein
MEREPFLPEYQASEANSGANKRFSFDYSRHYRFFICIFTLKFLNQFCGALLEIPLLRLVEHALCRPLQNGGRDEAICKTPMVQDELAFLMGFKWAFDAIPCTDIFSQLSIGISLSLYRSSDSLDVRITCEYAW